MAFGPQTEDRDLLEAEVMHERKALCGLAQRTSQNCTCEQIAKALVSSPGTASICNDYSRNHKLDTYVAEITWPGTRVLCPPGCKVQLDIIRKRK
jgi:hypothetical protein